jgi:hypothetical protein
MPQVLRLHQIPFHCIRQKKGEYVIIFPGAYHMVVNAGQNTAEAINFCMPKWENFVPIEECLCRDIGNPKDTGHPGLQEKFVIKGRQGFIVNATPSARCFETAAHGADDLNTGKCSKPSVGVAFTIDVFLLSF